MKVALEKGDELGSGGFGTVYRAVELNSNHVVALKQSRVSLRVKRPLLQHEARVLKWLAGHAAVPQVYGYGRIEHFELLSMQLLDKSLGDVVDEHGPLPVDRVFDIADQLVAALEHIHTRGLVHRDVKPDNVLFQSPDSRHVCLVDFGFAYPAPGANQVAESYLPGTSEVTTVFGTLPYASLNAHRTSKLTYRDDMESLAYTLLFLLRGSLPWSHYTRHGTVHGRIRQVYEQKRRHGGSQLAAGLPNEFGELLDYARSLSPGEFPNYHEWLGRLRVAESRNQDVSYNQDHSVPKSKDRPPSPVQPGQLALLRLIPSITAEGYSIQADHEHSYVRDSRFDTPEWNFPRKPCVILEVEWDERAKAHCFTAAPISNHDELERCNPLRVSICGPDSALSHSQQTAISTTPDWPFKRSYCYAFKRLTKFHCLPSQEVRSSYWTINSSGIEVITKRLTPPPNPNSFATLHDLESPDPDTRYDAKMRTGYVKHYAELSPLTPTELNDESVDWNSTRGWFDECVKASRYYDRCNGNLWTRAPPSQTSKGPETDFSDSYSEEDFEDWERQQERDRSLTLVTVLEGSELADVLDELDEIELVE
ncbi:unnamed protein product [Rhizoctonia solani]|nr:unnamed protein product [Rhizoctonia solani]